LPLRWSAELSDLQDKDGITDWQSYHAFRCLFGFALWHKMSNAKWMILSFFAKAYVIKAKAEIPLNGSALSTIHPHTKDVLLFMTPLKEPSCSFCLNTPLTKNQALEKALSNVFRQIHTGQEPSHSPSSKMPKED
jgi:hypothetical protein